ncbi:MAG: PIN domain-containing protein [bacterium]|nr:PIN domain-containing protein [bacterium]
MKVLVDTSVWSLALRRERTGEEALVQELAELIAEQRVAMIGPVRQELLSGIRDNEQFIALQERLRAFPDLPLTESDFQRAAEYFNSCRAMSVQGSNTDFLLCAVAVNHHLAILTADRDFDLFAQHLPLRLLQARS